MIPDDEGLTKPFGQPLTYEPRVDIDRSTLRKDDDDPHQPRRICLPLCNTSGRR
jgi:hypothetical protein